jgi:rare lipoprotein A
MQANRIKDFMFPPFYYSCMFYILIILFFGSCSVVDSEDEDCFVATGIASWYGEDYHGTKTANGEIYDMESMTAAHKTLPFNTKVLVENLDNGKTVTVRINNRGPYVQGRIIDLSRKAAREIDIITAGLAEVELHIVTEGDLSSDLVRCGK